MQWFRDRATELEILCSDPEDQGVIHHEWWTSDICNRIDGVGVSFDEVLGGAPASQDFTDQMALYWAKFKPTVVGHLRSLEQDGITGLPPKPWFQKSPCKWFWLTPATLQLIFSHWSAVEEGLREVCV